MCIHQGAPAKTYDLIWIVKKKNPSTHNDQFCSVVFKFRPDLYVGTPGLRVWKKYFR